MKIEETKTIEVKDVVKYICDFCAAEAPNNYDWDGDDSDKSVEIGSYRTEGKAYISVVVDMCPKCFDKKLIPWMESQGVKAVEKRST